MQFLVFHLGRDRYGLNTHHLKRVLPLMELKQIPKTPDYVAGLMNFHGIPVPVIDLCALACGTPCTLHFDTRILLIDYHDGAAATHLLGLIVERVTAIEQIDIAVFTQPGVSAEHAPFLGKVAAHDGALLQLVNVEHLLTEEVRSILFASEARATQ